MCAGNQKPRPRLVKVNVSSLNHPARKADFLLPSPRFPVHFWLSRPALPRRSLHLPLPPPVLLLRHLPLLPRSPLLSPRFRNYPPPGELSLTAAITGAAAAMAASAALVMPVIHPNNRFRLIFSFPPCSPACPSTSSRQCVFFPQLLMVFSWLPAFWFLNLICEIISNPVYPKKKKVQKKHQKKAPRKHRKKAQKNTEKNLQRFLLPPQAFQRTHLLLLPGTFSCILEKTKKERKRKL